MLTLVVRDLQYRRWRIVLVVSLIAVVIALLFLMNGLIGQFNREPVLAVEQIGGTQGYVVASGSSGPLTTPQAVSRAGLEAIPGSTVFLMGRTTVDEQPIMLVGLPLDGMDLSIEEGELPTEDRQMVIDEQSGFLPGDSVVLGDQQISVVARAEDATVLAGLPLAFVPLRTAQQALLGGENIVSGALIEEFPENRSPALKFMTAAEVADDVRSPLDSAIASVSMVRLLLWAVTGVIIGTTIYVTAAGRVRDVAVLKAVGGRDALLAGSLMIEAVIIALTATAIAAVLQQLARPLFPLLIRIPPATWWQVPLIAVSIALFAAALGVRKVLTTSPAEAFG